MDKQFLIIIILIFVSASVWQYYKFKKISNRNIISEFELKYAQVSLSWKQFILPCILLLVGFLGEPNLFLIFMAIGLIFSVIQDWVYKRKYHYCVFAISANNLISNDFRLNTFNLDELTMIDFKSFIDSFKLQFKNGQFALIHRPDFNNEVLISFLETAIGKSKLSVVIDEDAKTKIYMKPITIN